MSNTINKSVVSDTYIDTDQLKNQVVELNKTLERLHEHQQELIISGEKSSKTFQDVAAKIRFTDDAIKDATKQIDANIKALNQSKNSLEQNKGLLESLNSRYTQITKSQGDNSKEAQALNIQIGTLSNTIAQQEEKLSKSREVFDLHKETNKQFASSFEEINKKASTFGPGFENTLQDAANGFNAMKTGLSAVKTGFQTVGGAIKTTGFGLLVLVLQSVVEYFTKTEGGAKKLKAIISAVSVIVNTFKTGLASFGELFVNAFTHPVDSIKKLGQALVENVINRVKGLVVIWEGIRDKDFTKVSNGILQTATGVTNLATKAKKAFTEVHEVQQKIEKQNHEIHKTEKGRVAERNKMGTQRSGNQARRKKSKAKPEEYLELIALNFTDKVKIELQSYEDEQKLLDEQYDKKLLSQQQYQEESQKLLQKYHQDTGGHIKDFGKVELKQVSESLEAVKTASMKKIVIGMDEKAVDKALLPKQKFDAEKKLIEDKYFYDIKLAGENAEQVKLLEDQKLADLAQLNKKYEDARKEFQLQTAQQVADAGFSILQNNIKAGSAAKLKQLETQKTAELINTSLTGAQKKAIEEKYKKKEAEEKVKAFKAEQRTSILQAVVNGALAITKATAQTGLLAPFVVPGIIASTAIQVATIAAQKAPQYAKGGLHYQSDGKGAVLPGYSRTDNTNAYLRSGEAVVVSEAMRNPWARNLVSAINVAYGGRDFSVINPSRGYAIGGIFSDGGNSNRYYNQPMNDQQALANSIGYQMVNNFPPIYVDVKDVNNQQSILAQTVNRVNL